MTCSERTILLVDQNTATVENVRELIEFMDAPSVVTAMPADWQDRLGKRRLEALFVGPGLTDKQISTLLSAVAQIDPNVPVVMMQQSAF